MERVSQTLKTPRKLWRPPSEDDFFAHSAKKIKLQSAEEEKNEEINLPITVDDLAIHPKKVEEVQYWFDFIEKTKPGAMLLITGPPGCGKTSCITALARHNGLTVCEWINPIEKMEFDHDPFLVNDPFDRNNYRESSQYDKFCDFVFRTANYQTLFNMNQKRIILLKDFPNVFLHKPLTFQKFLEVYSKKGRSPIAFICTDDQNFKYINDLFPTNIKSLYSIHHIKFNAISKTLMTKVLTTHCKPLSNSKSQDCKELIENIYLRSCGDLRSAMTSLTITGINFKRKQNVNNFLLPSKDDPADFFQLIGRILYPKRITDEIVPKRKRKEVKPTKTPKHQTFVHSICEIADKLSLHSNILHLLQENYVNTSGDITSMIESALVLSCADFYDLDFDVLKEYQSIIVTGGLMLANSKPKKGSFKPLKQSYLHKVFKNQTSDILDKRTQYANCRASSRTLNLDFIPFMKNIPSQVGKLNFHDLNRLQTNDQSNIKCHEALNSLPKTSTVPFSEEKDSDSFDDDNLEIECDSD